MRATRKYAEIQGHNFKVEDGWSRGEYLVRMYTNSGEDISEDTFSNEAEAESHWAKLIQDFVTKWR